jgi:hypothetical protein
MRRALSIVLLGLFTAGLLVGSAAPAAAMNSQFYPWLAVSQQGHTVAAGGPCH